MKLLKEDVLSHIFDIILVSLMRDWDLIQGINSQLEFQRKMHQTHQLVNYGYSYLQKKYANLSVDLGKPQRDQSHYHNDNNVISECKIQPVFTLFIIRLCIKLFPSIFYDKNKIYK